MKLLKPYESLEDTLLKFKRQVKDSIAFADGFLPNRSMTPGQIFSFLKKRTIYFNDPPTEELLQMMPTMFSKKNAHNIYGAGDCDCFTIAALACLFARGYGENYVVIVGRNARNAVHIYCKTNYLGEKKTLDLTNHSYNYERYYPYRQELPITL
jgi:hypothetical protein